jgi:hypothetical protein
MDDFVVLFWLHTLKASPGPPRRSSHSFLAEMSAWGLYGDKGYKKGKGWHGWEKGYSESWAMSGEAMQELGGGEFLERRVPSRAP